MRVRDRSMRRSTVMGALAAFALTIGSSIWFACEVEQPAVESEDYEKPLFLHSKVEATAENCSDCHENNRPTPQHGSGKDCIGCHTPSDTKSGFLPAQTFTHSPPPDSCYPCHKRERPAPPHAQEGNCAGCHKYPNWQPG